MNTRIAKHQSRFLRYPVTFGLCLLLLIMGGCSSEPKDGAVALEPLPYAEDALEPHISEKTMKLHYHNHYAGYIARTNALLKSCRIKDHDLAEVVKAAASSLKNQDLFTNAAQAWNHAFFWKCLTPKDSKPPQGRLKQMIDDSFGGLDPMKQMIAEAAKTIVGSGWVWIVQDGEKLVILPTANADTPIAYGRNPIFTIDVWEHAYYLDYQNKRAGYVSALLDNIVNWTYVGSQLE